jgi:dihydrofolate synthase / folylpolyglutamate synthase
MEMIPMLEQYKERWQVKSDRGIKPGLEAMEAALRTLNNPEKGLHYVHFAGTNGKGSTLTFVEQIACQHGLTVGKFMSPCVLDVHDQIQINGENILPNQLDAIFQQFKEAGLSGRLTDFELLTCAAFVHFSQQQVDLVLLEAGMGGRLDSTNVIVPIVSVIPSIALEHTNFLGDTIEQIAHHKAGIIKQNKTVISGNLPVEAKGILKNEAIAKQAELHTLHEQFTVASKDDGEVYKHVQLNIEIDQLQRKLLGAHQADNMALAITAFLLVAKALKIDIHKTKIREAIRRASVPGRFEEVMPQVYFDGAHNPASIQALCALIESQFQTKEIHLILGMLADKDVKQVLTLLEPLVTKLSFIDVPNERAMSAQKMFELSNHVNKEIIVNVVDVLKREVPENTIRIVTGSLYLLADIRNQLKDGEK